MAGLPVWAGIGQVAYLHLLGRNVEAVERAAALSRHPEAASAEWARQIGAVTAIVQAAGGTPPERVRIDSARRIEAVHGLPTPLSVGTALTELGILAALCDESARAARSSATRSARPSSTLCSCTGSTSPGSRNGRTTSSPTAAARGSTSGGRRRRSRRRPRPRRGAGAPPRAVVTTLRLGIFDHFGWAVAVTATHDGEVVDRRRIELVDPDSRRRRCTTTRPDSTTPA